MQRLCSSSRINSGVLGMALNLDSEILPSSPKSYPQWHCDTGQTMLSTPNALIYEDLLQERTTFSFLSEPSEPRA